MEKVLAIIRESTDRQESESQKKELIEFLTGYGYKEEQIVVIETTGASARKKNSKYLQMLQEIKDTITMDLDIKAVGLWSLDRLGRVDDSLIEMKNWFIKNRIQVYCKSPSLILLRSDGTVDQGAEIAYGVFAALVKQQTEDIFNKFKRGKDRNREQGKYNGGIIRAGYTTDDSGKFVIDPTEGALVKDIYRRYISGDSYTKIYDDLKATGTMFRGGLITYNLIHHVLVCKDYTGTGVLPELISKEDWESARVRRETSLSPKVSKHKDLLGAGLFKCPICGYGITPYSGYYSCISFMKKRIDSFPDCTNNRHIRVVVLEEILKDYIEYWKKTFYQEKVQEDYKKELEDLELKKREISRLIARQTDKLSRLKELYLNLEISDGDYKRKRGALIKETIGLQASQGRIQEQVDSLRPTDITPGIRSIISSSVLEYLPDGCVLIKVLGKHQKKPRVYRVNKLQRKKPWELLEEGA